MGAGFWVLDDITALRQIDQTSANADAILFRPAEAFKLPAPDEQGTPLPKDEPSAENPPAGAVIDYYLKAAASGPVALEILDASGAVVRRFASDDRPQPRDPNTLAVQLISVGPAGRPRPAAAVAAGGGGPACTGGLGSATWRSGRRRRARPWRPRRGRCRPAGTVCRAIVRGRPKTFTQPLIVRQDPRGTL